VEDSGTGPASEEHETGDSSPPFILRSQPLEIFPTTQVPQTSPGEPLLEPTAVINTEALARSADAEILVIRPPQLDPPTRQRHAGVVATLLALDAVALGLALGVGLLAAALAGSSPSPLWVPALAPAILLASFIGHGMYRSNGLRLIPSGMPTFRAVAHSLPLAALATIAVLFASGTVGGTFAVFALTAGILLPSLLTVPALRSAAAHLGSHTGLGRKQRVLVIGAGEAADHVVQRLRRHGVIDAVGMVDDDPLPGFETIGTLADVPRLCRELGIDRVIVALPRAPWLAVSEAVQPLIGTVDVSVVPSLYELMTWRSGLADLAGMPLVPLVPAQHGAVAAIAKRTIDLALGSVAVVATLPILLGAAIAIKTTSRGPVLFRQLRTGRNERDFTILKFRTMDVGAEARRADLLVQSDADGPRFKMANDPRVTRVGAFLRRYSIDELPQLFNVLRGNMSLVGPRPFPVVEAGALTVGPAAARFDMSPGLTGLWQVSGRSDLTWDDLCRLDSVYVGSWSVLWDLRILLQTPVAVLRRRGAY
jgi:exopolysaccharide biosynthesis polyprenyl glycosylphosphotransferase